MKKRSHSGIEHLGRDVRYVDLLGIVLLILYAIPKDAAFVDCGRDQWVMHVCEPHGGCCPSAIVPEEVPSS